MFIPRNHQRTKEDDWKLNVQPYLSNETVSVEIYFNNELLGWKILPRYEL